MTERDLTFPTKSWVRVSLGIGRRPWFDVAIWMTASISALLGAGGGGRGGGGVVDGGKGEGFSLVWNEVSRKFERWSATGENIRQTDTRLQRGGTPSQKN